MALGMSIDVFRSVYDKQTKIYDENTRNVSPDYASSLIYQKDYTENKTKIEAIRDNSGKAAIESCQRCITFADGATSTVVKDMVDELSAVVQGIQIDDKIKNVTDTIEKAVIDAYTENKQKFDENTTTIEKAIKEFDSNASDFDTAKSEYEIAERKYNSAVEGTKEKEMFKDQMDSAKSKAAKCYVACSTNITTISNKNTENTDLLDIHFIKKA